MITCHVESLAEHLEEIKVLLPLHYEELALNKDKVPLSPRYDIYVAREKAGELLFVTVRQAGEMVGYFIGFVAPGLHYSTCLTCVMDIFYVRKDLRKGRTGIRLFQFVRAELKRRGVQRWFVGSKIHADASALFKYLKLEPCETFYTQWLGD